jgi:hypothetical protein
MMALSQRRKKLLRGIMSGCHRPFLPRSDEAQLSSACLTDVITMHCKHAAWYYNKIVKRPYFSLKVTCMIIDRSSINDHAPAPAFLAPCRFLIALLFSDFFGFFEE